MKALALPLLLAAAVPAAAQDGLAANRSPFGCTIQAPPGPDSGVVVTIGVSRTSPWTQISGGNWGLNQSVPFRVTLRGIGADAAEPPATVTAMGSSGEGTEHSIRIDGLPPLLLRARTVAFHREGQASPFVTIRNPWFGKDDFPKQCAEALALDDRGSGKPAVHLPRLTRPLDTLVGNDDYPPAALRAEEQGQVSVVVTVSATGIATACDVTRSSGSAALDQRTCTVLRRRARFHPALDADARPTRGFYPVTLGWSIPGEEP